MDEFFQELSAQRRCLHCGHVYSERESMGTLACRRHTGERQSIYAERPGGIVGTWSCCGAAWHPRHEQWRGVEAARGCTPLDHTDSPGLPVDQTLPYEQALYLFGEADLAARHTVYKAARRELVIRRTDAAFA